MTNPQRLRTTIAETKIHWANRLADMAFTFYMEGRYTDASEHIYKALALDPSQHERFEAAARRIQTRATNRNQPIAARLSLRLQTQCRLVAAGITPDDKAISEVLNWNQTLGAIDGK
jgi:hypothetical protein